MTSTLLAIPNEDEVIDSYRPRIMFESPQVTQVDNPGEAPVVGLYEPHGSHLPDPSVGATASSGKDRIGWSSGIIGLRQRKAPLTGKIWTAPDVKAEPVQGTVGQNKHANQLQAGVRQQMAQYDGSLAANSQSFVGSLS